MEGYGLFQDGFGLDLEVVKFDSMYAERQQYQVWCG